MKLRLTFLLCALSLALPALAAAAAPSWGQTPGRFVRGPQIKTPHRTCNLSGLWIFHSPGPANYPTEIRVTDELRMTEKPRLRPNVLVYDVHSTETHGRRGVAYFNRASGRIELRTFFSARFPYGLADFTGTVSPNCAHLSLMEQHFPFPPATPWSMDRTGR